MRLITTEMEAFDLGLNTLSWEMLPDLGLRVFKVQVDVGGGVEEELVEFHTEDLILDFEEGLSK